MTRQKHGKTKIHQTTPDISAVRVRILHNADWRNSVRVRLGLGVKVKVRFRSGLGSNKGQGKGKVLR